MGKDKQSHQKGVCNFAKKVVVACAVDGKVSHMLRTIENSIKKLNKHQRGGYCFYCVTETNIFTPQSTIPSSSTCITSLSLGV